MMLHDARPVEPGVVRDRHNGVRQRPIFRGPQLPELADHHPFDGGLDTDARRKQNFADAKQLRAAANLDAHPGRNEPPQHRDVSDPGDVFAEHDEMGFAIPVLEFAVGRDLHDTAVSAGCLAVVNDAATGDQVRPFLAGIDRR